MFAESAAVVRPLTLELCCAVLRRLLLALEESDPLFQMAVEEAALRSEQRLLATLRAELATEKLFLEMFEDEYYQLEVSLRYATIPITK